LALGWRSARRRRRWWRGSRTRRGRRARIQPQLLEANLDHAAHASFLPRPLWRAAALSIGVPLVVWRWTGLRRRLRLSPVVALEGRAQPLQFQDQGFALRADVARRLAARTFQHIIMGFAITAHDAAPSSASARRTTFGAAAACRAATCWLAFWLALFTRANT